MRVINYGPGCESKRVTCGSCKSELEYIQKDIKYYDSKFEGNSNYKQRFLEYIYCPVCEARIFTTTTPIENLEEKQMKTIKTITCSRCKTELQYTKEDIEIRVCKGHVDNPIMVVQYVPCPICRKENDIAEEC